jgi:hypothetical protein
MCGPALHAPAPRSKTSKSLPSAHFPNMSFNPQSVLYNQPGYGSYCRHHYHNTYSTTKNTPCNDCSNSSILCSICNVSVAVSLWPNHLQDRYHQESSKLLVSYNAAEETLSSRRRTVNEILPMVSELGLPRWRDDLRSQLLGYVMDQSITSLCHVKEALGKYDLKERISCWSLRSGSVYASCPRKASPQVTLWNGTFGPSWVGDWRSKTNDIRVPSQ